MKGEPVGLPQGFYTYLGRDNGPVEGWIGSTDVDLRMLAGGQEARLLSDFAYVDAYGFLHRARTGLVFDGGSKPWWTWPIVGHPWNEYLPAYVIHDQQCDDIRVARDLGAISADVARQHRRISDNLFREGMTWLKRNKLNRAGSWVRRLEVQVKYLAVRLHAWRTLGIW